MLGEGRWVGEFMEGWEGTELKKVSDVSSLSTSLTSASSLHLPFALALRLEYRRLCSFVRAAVLVPLRSSVGGLLRVH